VDPAKNDSPSKMAFEIQTKTSTTQILVIPTNEELEIAEQTVACIENGREGGV
jgi:acetate kinase